MKKTLIILLIVFLSFQSKAQDNNTIKYSSDPKADSLLNRLVDIDKNVGIVGGYSIDGEINWISAAGLSDRESMTKANADTKMRMASIAKPMTAIAILQLVEKELLDLDEPIHKYLPDYPDKKEGIITTRHLLTHTSGIQGYKSSKERQNMHQYSSLTEAVNLFKRRKLEGKPGKVYQYTTYGYTLLGLIIEQVSGMDYEAYMQKNIWDKAGMSNTGIEKINETYENKSSLYHKDSKGRIKEGIKTNLSDRVPGGGFYSTVADMLKFGNAVLNHQLVTEATTSKMLTDTGLKKEGNPYGMGWFLYGNNDKFGEVYGHGGAQMGSSTQLMILPEKKIVSIVMSNTSGAGSETSYLAVQLFYAAAEKIR